jgi:predicted dehydrogenase
MAHDELKVMLRCSGKIGLITVSLAVSPRYQFLNIYGTKMSIFLDFLSNTIIKHSIPKMIPKAISRAFMNLSTARIITFATIWNFWKVLNKTFTPYEGTEILIKEFYRSLTEGGEVPVPAQEGLKSMEIMDKVWSEIKNI